MAAKTQKVSWKSLALNAEDETRRQALMVSLTVREYQVLKLAAQGLRNRQIGAGLGIKTGTVKIHVSRIFVKFGVRKRCDLFHLAAELGVEPGPKTLSRAQIVAELIGRNKILGKRLESGQLSRGEMIEQLMWLSGRIDQLESSNVPQR
jgi:DNA-binding CsgD family transcriptional regulator